MLDWFGQDKKSAGSASNASERITGKVDDVRSRDDTIEGGDVAVLAQRRVHEDMHARHTLDHPDFPISDE
ncbi:hypothetical protein OKW43_004950 [Paraburkholderia sp. WC7.3g]|uniref:Uncharacterized protein n=1 Tax=Paraburkholderia podalyriae TaxID=1938811 RepID=A0ABR7PI54_9BURK|nr:hypothetical protein [Paraburkholderia podalyriae]MBC8745975.1 hypothetical protein [Paraburkholderia podalyriae]